MDALAEAWEESGRDSEHLYKGDTKEIIPALDDWYSARRLWVRANIELLFDLFRCSDEIYRLRDRHGTLEHPNIDPFKAKHVKNVARVKEFTEQRERANVQALFLLANLRHRGYRWKVMPHETEWSDMDAAICTILQMADPEFQSRAQLKILEMEEVAVTWWREYADREPREAARTLGITDDSELDLFPRTRVTVAFGAVPKDSRRGLNRYSLPEPIDVTDLLPPPPLPTDRSFESSPSPEPVEAVEEAPPEPEESAEVIAERIDRIDIAEEDQSVGTKAKTKGVDTAEEDNRVEKKSKTQLRNIQRKKAKSRAKEAVKAGRGSENEAGSSHSPTSTT